MMIRSIMYVCVHLNEKNFIGGTNRRGEDHPGPEGQRVLGVFRCHRGGLLHGGGPGGRPPGGVRRGDHDRREGPPVQNQVGRLIF